MAAETEAEHLFSCRAVDVRCQRCNQPHCGALMQIYVRVLAAFATQELRIFLTWDV